MPALRPVLVVGTGDLSHVRVLLQAHRFGVMLAPSVDQARLMLREFRVDAIVSFFAGPDDAAALMRFRTPLVLVGADPMPGRGVDCAAFVSEHVDTSILPRILTRVVKGERGIYEGLGAA
jgi:hypothetical protein